MRTILLSVAHAPQSQGETSGELSEYILSRSLTERVAALLQFADYPAHWFDIGGRHPEWDYKGKVLHNKADQVDAMAYGLKTDCLGVELHWNTEDTTAGTAVLFASDDPVAKDCARVLKDSLVENLQRGKHWHGPLDGLIEVPGPYYDDDPKVRFTFLHRTKTPAVIVELDAMRFAPWYADNEGDVALAVCLALQAVATTI